MNILYIFLILPLYSTMLLLSVSSICVSDETSPPSASYELECESDSPDASTSAGSESTLSEQLDNETIKKLNDLSVTINEYLKKNDFAGAIPLLRESEVLMPGNADIKNTLATALNNYAVSRAEENNLSSALETIEEAYTINPSASITQNYCQILSSIVMQDIEQKRWLDAINTYKYILSLPHNTSYTPGFIAGIYVQWGVELAGAKQIDQAQDKWNQALEINPDQKEALFFLGQAAYQKQQLAEAKFFWDKYAQIDKDNEAFTGMMAKLNRELEIEQSLKKREKTHFSLHYDGVVDRSTLLSIQSTLEQAYQSLGSRFSYYPDDKIIVILLNSDQFQYDTNLPHWVAGVYDGKIRIPITEDTGSLAETIFHEYTHVIIHHLGDNKVPRWINEGIAERFSRKKYDYELLKKCILQNQYIPFNMLDTSLVGLGNPFRIKLAYDESTLCIDYIVYRYGIHKIKMIVQKCKEGMPFDKIIPSVFGISEQEFEKNWKEYAKDTLLSITEQKKLRYLIKSNKKK